jgi:exosortase
MEKVRHQANKIAAGIKTYYQYIISAALLILLVLIVYGRDLGILLNEAIQSEALSYTILVPFFLGIILYPKRNVVKASLALEKYQQKTKTKYVDELVGVILCLVAFLMYWYGSYTFYPLEYHILSIPIFVMGTTLILFSMKALIALIFPILFLLFLVPIPTEFLYAGGSVLANFDTQISYVLLKALNIPVVLNTSYGSPAIELTSSAGNPANFSIGLPCSGVYSLLAFAMFAAFLAFVISGPLLKKGLTFVLGFLVFGIINIFRISSIITIAYWGGEEVAMLIYHTIAGVLFIVIGMLFVLFISEKLWKIQVLPAPPAQQSCSKCETSTRNLENFCANCGRFLNPVRTKISQKFWMKTFMLLLACSIVVLSLNAPTFAVAQGPLGVATNANWQNATGIFPQIPNYSLGFLYRDTQYEQIAQQDASLLYAYMNKSRQTVYVDVGVSSSLSNLHNWEVCLISLQTSEGQYPLVTLLDSRDIQLLQGVPIIARYLTFTRPDNLTQITLYWYEQAPFNTGVTVEQKYVRISLLILTNNATDYQRWENELLPIGQTVAEYWEPLKSQSLISLGVPAQQALLGFSIIAVAFMKTAQYSNDRRKKTNNQHIFNNFASEEDRITLQTIQDLTTTHKRHLEMRDIAEAIKEKTGKRTKFEKLFATLTRLEEYGFVKRDIISTQNQPKLVWKTQ